MPISSRKVLVVEDEDTTRRAIVAVLEHLGVKVIREVDDGAKAWTSIKQALESQRPFDLVISDWKMPEMTGLELLKKVRSHEETVELPFILLTGVNEKSQILAAIRAKVTTYISKPFEANLFETKVREALE